MRPLTQEEFEKDTALIKSIRVEQITEERDDSLAGTVALITGSSRGLGAGIARTFARHGASVVIHGLDGDEATRTAEGIQAGRGIASVLVADLRDEKDCRWLVRNTIERWNRLDIVVNNAGIFPRGNVESTSVALWDEIFAVNLRAPFIVCQEAVKSMKTTGGCIINIGSVNAHFGLRNLLAYSASKGGLTILTKNLANDLLRYRIRVNQINPGWVLTEGEDSMQSMMQGPQWLEQANKSRPFGRLLSPEDVARAALFFAVNPLATGAVLDYDQVPVGAPGEI